MKLFAARKPPTARSEIAQAVVLSIGYAAMGQWLAATGWMAVLLSPSGKPPFGVVAVVMAYIVLRLIVILVLPGMIVVRTWHYLSSRGGGGDRAEG